MMLLNPIDLDDTGFADAVEDRSAASQKSSNREPQHLRHRVVSCAWVVAVFIACAVAFGLFISERERLASWNHFSLGGTRTSSSRVTGREVATGGVHHATTRTGEHEGEETAFSFSTSSFRARSTVAAPSTSTAETDARNELASVSAVEVDGAATVAERKLRTVAGGNNVPMPEPFAWGSAGEGEKKRRGRAGQPRRTFRGGEGGQHQVEIQAKVEPKAASALQRSDEAADSSQRTTILIDALLLAIGAVMIVSMLIIFAFCGRAKESKKKWNYEEEWPEGSMEALDAQEEEYPDLEAEGWAGKAGQTEEDFFADADTVPRGDATEAREGEEEEAGTAPAAAAAGEGGEDEFAKKDRAMA